MRSSSDKRGEKTYILLFQFAILVLDVKAPKNSNPAFRKGYRFSASANPKLGRSAISGVIFCALHRRQMKHVLLSSFKNCLNPIMMKSCCSWARANSVPKCLQYCRLAQLLVFNIVLTIKNKWMFLVLRYFSVL